MNPDISKLIAYISSQISQRGGYPTKTKVLKLLYLFDVAYYRKHRVLFTEFDWIFLHFGPWTSEYEQVLESAVNDGLISRNRGEQAEYLNSRTSVEIEQVLPKIADELSLRRILDSWADEPLNRLLDYVYFNTEPMIHGARTERLDFSKISETVSRSYSRPKPTKTRKELDQLKTDILKRIKETDAPFKPKEADKIKHDEVFYKGLKALEDVE